MDSVEVGDLRIGYQSRGEGPYLLLLHGAVCDSRVWRVEIESLSDAFTVVAWDAPGCGRSADPPEHFRLPEYADCLAAVMDALGIDRAHVLGHSWGSALALELYRMRPDAVRSLILVGAYAGWAGSLPAAEVERRLAFALRIADSGSGGFEPTSMPGLFSGAMPADRAEELAQLMSETRPAGTRTMARALAAADLRDVLPHIDVPTLILHGEDDKRSSLAVATAIHASIPQSSLLVLPGLGHECYLESAETFDAAVRDFLTQLA